MSTLKEHEKAFIIKTSTFKVHDLHFERVNPRTAHTVSKSICIPSISMSYRIGNALCVPRRPGRQTAHMSECNSTLDPRIPYKKIAMSKRKRQITSNSLYSKFTPA